jgi:uncharacterized membrane protein
MRLMHSTQFQKKRLATLLLLALAAIAITLWLVFTPPGLEGKVWAAGYAVCHQLESHTIDFRGRLLPLCARCTGMYLGALVSLVILQKRKHAAGAPSKSLQVALIFFLVAFIVDGVNSTLGFFSSFPQLYPPNNWLRLITGLMMGVVISNLLIVLWHQTWWKQAIVLPALTGWLHFGIIVAANILAGILVWLRIPILYYPVAIFSTLTIVILLTMIYCLIWIIIFKKENTYETYGEGLRFILAGLATAVIQIALLDLLRYSLTGTWQGFSRFF